MKKLIAISVMCALVAGAAFADTSVGGQVFVGGALAQGDNVNGTHVNTGPFGNDKYNTSLKINFSEGNAGGRIRILGENADKGDIFDEWFGWWRPTDFLKLQLGVNKDGDFGTAQISGWGFTGENKNNSGMQGAMGEYSGYGEGRNHSRSTGWYGGVDKPSLNVSIYPPILEGLAINIAFPGLENGQPSIFTLARFHAQVQYDFMDIGKLSVSFVGDTGYLEADPDSWWVSEQTGMPKAYLSFYTSDFYSLVDGLGLDIGLAYRFSLKNERTEATTNYPFEVGLGLRAGAGDFNFKVRAALSTGASTVPKEGDTVKEDTELSFNVLPSYKIGNVTVNLYAGMGIKLAANYEEGDGTQYDINESGALVAWFINPYVFIPTSGSIRFKVGFQIYSDGLKFMANKDDPSKAAGDRDPAKINWAIPLGFYTYF